MSNRPTGIDVVVRLMPHMGFFSWSVPDNIIHADKIYANIYEIDLHEMALGIPVELILSRMTEADRNRLAERIHDVLLGEEPWVSRYKILCPSGKTKELVSLGSCSMDADGMPSVYAGAVLLVDNVDVSIGIAQLEARVSDALGLARDAGLEITERYLASALRSIPAGL